MDLVILISNKKKIILVWLFIVDPTFGSIWLKICKVLIHQHTTLSTFSKTVHCTWWIFYISMSPNSQKHCIFIVVLEWTAWVFSWCSACSKFSLGIKDSVQWCLIYVIFFLSIWWCLWFCSAGLKFGFWQKLKPEVLKDLCSWSINTR